MTLWRHIPELVLRPAVRADIPALSILIDRSARTLCAKAYNEQQMRSWMTHAFFVDETLIDDGTYCVAEVEGRIIGAGGWSRRKRLFQGEAGAGADGGAGEDVFATPSTDPARLRMFFIDPGWTRRGIGRRIVEYCEAQVIDAGFRHFELMATLTGEPLYAACGYAVLERVELRLRDGVMVEGVRMSKHVGQPERLQSICESPALSECDALATRSVSNSANGSKIQRPVTLKRGQASPIVLVTWLFVTPLCDEPFRLAAAVLWRSTELPIPRVAIGPCSGVDRFPTSLAPRSCIPSGLCRRLWVRFVQQPAGPRRTSDRAGNP